MTILTGNPLFDLLILLVFVAFAVALVRGAGTRGRDQDGGGRGAGRWGWASAHDRRRAELDARRGIRREAYDPEAIADSTPLVRLARQRGIIGAVLFVVMAVCLVIVFVHRMLNG